MIKKHADSFSEKISAEQKVQLIEWCAEHTYSEVKDLIAAASPDGFGLAVSTSTISRFYKANFDAVSEFRRKKLSDRGLEARHFADHRDDFYRLNLAHGATISLQERVFDMLAQPVETIDDLKKLVYICKQVKDLGIELGPHSAAKDQIFRDMVERPLNALMEARSKQKADDVSESSDYTSAVRPAA